MTWTLGYAYHAGETIIRKPPLRWWKRLAIKLRLMREPAPETWVVIAPKGYLMRDGRRIATLRNVVLSTGPTGTVRGGPAAKPGSGPHAARRSKAAGRPE